MRSRKTMKWVAPVILLVLVLAAFSPATGAAPSAQEPSAISCGDSANCTMSTPAIQVVNNGTGAGIWGQSTTTGIGLRGISKQGIGVRGQSNIGAGVAGKSITWAGVQADSTSGPAIRAQSTSGSGVYIPSAGYHGIHIVNTGFQGVYIENAGLNGVRAHTWGATINTAALRGENLYTDGIGVRGAGGYGVVGSSDQGAWAGYFYDNIYVEGSCTGCLLGYIAQNDDTSPLEPGDVVAISGVLEPLAGQATPVFKVRRAANAQAAIIGVVQARGQAGESPDGGGVAVKPVEGAVEPNEYLLIVTQGPIQVKAEPGSGIQAGDLVSLGDTGLAALAAAERPTIGRALDAVDPASGLLWVLVDLQ